MSGVIEIDIFYLADQESKLDSDAMACTFGRIGKWRTPDPTRTPEPTPAP